jgi:hypothetical protein
MRRATWFCHCPLFFTHYGRAEVLQSSAVDIPVWIQSSARLSVAAEDCCTPEIFTHNHGVLDLATPWLHIPAQPAYLPDSADSTRGVPSPSGSEMLFRVTLVSRGGTSALRNRSAVDKIPLTVFLSSTTRMRRT